MILNIQLKYFKSFWPILIASLFFSGCSKLKLAADIPAYISIPSVILKVAPDGSQGSASHKIDHVWVYVNEELSGTFELPAKFPVLKSGNVKIRITAGIKVNGISATRQEYPFFRSYEIDVNLEEEKVLEIIPEFIYNQATVFKLLENFEALPEISVSFARSGQSDAFPELETGSNVFEGAFCGKLSMLPDMLRMECSSALNFELPRQATPVFLELNFKTNIPINVGVYANQQLGGVNQLSGVVLNKTINPDGSLFWNKIYVELTPEVSSSTNARDFKIFFGAQKTGDEINQAFDFYFDNIKLVTF